MACALKAAIPMLQLPVLWRMLLILPGFYAYWGILTLLRLVIPSQAQVRKDRIQVAEGESQWRVKSEAVTKTRIIIFAANRIRLRIFYSVKGQSRSHAIGVAGRVDLARLSELLPTRPQIWDARDRYERSRRRRTDQAAA